MKNLFTLCAVAVMALTFAACGNAANKNNADTTDSIETAVTTEAPVAVAAEESVLDKYEALINQTIELQGKVAAGDAAAAQQLVTVSEEMNKISAELQTAMANMSAEDAQRFAELGQKLAGAASAAAAQ